MREAFLAFEIFVASFVAILVGNGIDNAHDKARDKVIGNKDKRMKLRVS